MQSRIEAPRAAVMRFWWVNQNQTYDDEVGGRFLWSPKVNSNGYRNQFYDNMLEVAAGDLVFSFSNTRIRAVGVVQGPAETGAKPDFKSSPDNWSHDGWIVPVEYIELGAPFRPKDQIDDIRPLLAAKYFPLQQNGDGLQGVYLAAISDELGTLLAKLSAVDPAGLLVATNPDLAVASEIAEFVESKPDLPETEVEQIIKARRGQGIFRTRLQQVESRCRVTGTTEPGHLRASHIKPWQVSSPDERLDGQNGLFLAPHIDHLFDRGWISFGDDGALLVAAQLDSAILDQWGIVLPMNVGSFTAAQKVYLHHHRDVVCAGTDLS